MALCKELSVLGKCLQILSQRGLNLKLGKLLEQQTEVYRKKLNHLVVESKCRKLQYKISSKVKSNNLLVSIIHKVSDENKSFILELKL